MRYLLLILFLAFNVGAAPLLATMEQQGGAITITFTDFADAQGFENYTCNVDFGGWVYTMPARKIMLNDEAHYRCTDQGGLQSGQRYDVWFTFEDRPYSRRAESPVVKLQAR